MWNPTSRSHGRRHSARTALAASALGIQPDILSQEPATLPGKCGRRIYIKCIQVLEAATMAPFILNYLNWHVREIMRAVVSSLSTKEFHFRPPLCFGSLAHLRPVSHLFPHSRENLSAQKHQIGRCWRLPQGCNEEQNILHALMAQEIRSEPASS